MSRRAGEPFAAAALVVLSVLALGPVLWSRGYVLIADMTFVPDQPWKPAWLGLDGSVPRAVPADAVVSVLGQVLPGDLVQKGILLGTLVLAGVGVLRLAGRSARHSAAACFGGAVLYVWNPYVFERLAIGHWGLLVGYAALPWVAAVALDVRRDAARAPARLVLLLGVAAIGSPTGGLVAGLVAIVLVADGSHRLRSVATAGAVLLVNLPWIAPALLNDAPPADGSGVDAFAATSDTALGAFGSLLTFGGIWKEAAAPGERGVMVLVVATLVIVVLSLAALARTAGGRGATTPLPARRLLVLACLGLLIAGLPATGPGERFVTDLVEVFPGAGLWRDSQKWLMPFVLAVCVGFVLLLDAVGARLRRQRLPATSAIVGLTLLPVVLLPSLAWGLSGRLDPVAFPREWQAVRSVMEHQPAADRRTAVLPWSAYQRLPWNDRRAALDPALRFFPGQVVANEDLTVSDAVTVRGGGRSADRIRRAIAEHQPIGPALAGAGVRYLLVEKTAPGVVGVALPSGRVLHDGPGLLLLDLGGRGRPAKSQHAKAIVTADAVTVLGLIVATILLVRRRSTTRIGYDRSGSSVNGDDADNR